ncbi:hypothetical protein GJ496_001483 [Pomphorhynchus laevis]|nr:hypothetical protein GJ496_001483 [Pomphorhynchus laevis]
MTNNHIAYPYIKCHIEHYMASEAEYNDEEDIDDYSTLSTISRSSSASLSDCRDDFNSTVTEVKDSQSNKNKKFKQSLSASETEESETCLICFESWTNSGPHRIVSLKCGHLFGKSCIEKWYRQNPTCPQCHHKIRSNDIRILYTKSIKVLDTSDLIRIKNELSAIKYEKKIVEIKLADSRLHCQMLEMDLKKLQAENKILREKSDKSCELSCDNRSTLRKRGAIRTDNIYRSDIIQKAGGRVLTYSKRDDLIIYSRQSTNSFFNGHGIVKVNAVDPRMTEFLPLHKQIIRDVCVNPITGTLLTCGMDSSAKLIDIRSNSIQTSYQINAPAWSCAWNCDSEYYFYIGLSSGLVFLYDCRMEESHVDQIIVSPGLAPSSPITSLEYLCCSKVNDRMEESHVDQIIVSPGLAPSSPITSLEYLCCSKVNDRGVFVGSLLKASIYSFNSLSSQNIDHTYHALPVKGSILSSHFENETKHLIISLRPTTLHPYVRHEAYHICNFNDLEYVGCIKGSRTAAFLTRARILRFAQDSQLYICAFDERVSAVKVFDISNSECMGEINKVNRVADICQLSSIEEMSVIATISPDAFSIYKLRYK